MIWRWRWVVLVVVTGCGRLATQLEVNAFGRDDAGLDAGVDAGPPEVPPVVTATGCWSSPTIVMAPNFGDGVVSVVSVLPSGDALVAWIEQDREGLQRVVTRAVFRDGGARDPEIIYDGAGAAPYAENNENLRLHSNAAGTTVLSWSHRADAGAVNELLITTRPPDAGWRAIERINPAGERVYWADVRIDARGELFATWAETLAQLGGLAIRFRHFAPDGGWSPPTAVQPDQVFFQAEPLLRVSETGEAIVAWQGYFPPTYEPEVHATSLRRGASTDTRLDMVGESPTFARAFALAPDGTAVLAWNRSRSELRVARRVSGAWLPSERLDSEDGGTISLHTVVDVDGSGRARAWWHGWDSTSRDVVSFARNDGSGWSAPLALDFIAADAPTYLLHASNGTGRAVLWWPRDRSLVVLGTDAPDAGVTDVIDGLMVGDLRYPPMISVGPSGTAWILARAASPDFRPLVMHCP